MVGAARRPLDDPLWQRDAQGGDYGLWADRAPGGRLMTVGRAAASMIQASWSI